MKKAIIYIPLLEEGTNVCRPTEGEEVADMIYRVLATPDYDPEIEYWLFPPGSVVRCNYEIRSGEKILVANERIDG